MHDFEIAIVSKFSICAIVSRASLHPDWFIVHIFFLLRFFSLSCFQCLCLRGSSLYFCSICLVQCPQPSLRSVFETLFCCWPDSFAKSLLSTRHFFNYHSNKKCISSGFNQHDEAAEARVPVIRCETFQLKSISNSRKESLSGRSTLRSKFSRLLKRFRQCGKCHRQINSFFPVVTMDSCQMCTYLCCKCSVQTPKRSLK